MPPSVDRSEIRQALKRGLYGALFFRLARTSWFFQVNPSFDVLALVSAAPAVGFGVARSRHSGRIRHAGIYEVRPRQRWPCLTAATRLRHSWRPPETDLPATRTQAHGYSLINYPNNLLVVGPVTLLAAVSGLPPMILGPAVHLLLRLLFAAPASSCRPASLPTGSKYTNRAVRSP